jgi:hypothetical protein
MELSPSQEPTSCSTTQENSSLLWNTKAHLHVHNTLSLDSALSQLNPHPIPSYFPMINFNIILPPMSSFSLSPLSFRFSYRNSLSFSPMHAICPAHLILLLDLSISADRWCTHEQISARQFNKSFMVFMATTYV